jgi:thymidylate synthase ThyX
VTQREAASGPHLRLESRRQFDRQARGHQRRNSRSERHLFHRVQVHARIFTRAVSILWKLRVRMYSLDRDSHRRYHNFLTPHKRVITVGPMPPEKSAYALARYSRSADSIRDSLAWVRSHDSRAFLESFYFQYGHASIADLGHLVVCFEGISELAASEIEAEPLWDGQARSSRYQDFSRSGFITPCEFSPAEAEAYRAAAANLLAAYQEVTRRALDCLSERHPRPADMKPETYRRNLAARAFDVSRYLLFWGVPTGVGQVTSIRTLERQIRRLKVSPYAELRSLAEEIAQACAAEPDCPWELSAALEPIAPTLARHADPDEHAARARADLRQWARQNLPAPASPTNADAPRVDLLHPTHVAADIAATLLYPVTARPFRELYELASAWSDRQRAEVIDVAMASRTRRDQLLEEFRGGLYAYDFVIDIGAYRDLHRHRRCQQFRQDYTGTLGFDTPALVAEAGAASIFDPALAAALETLRRLPAPGADYLMPFAARSRFLFKMDFAEAEYIARLRSGVKGHFSYRQIAWEMKCQMEQLEPELGRLIHATAPWVEDPLQR